MVIIIVIMIVSKVVVGNGLVIGIISVFGIGILIVIVVIMVIYCNGFVRFVLI